MRTNPFECKFQLRNIRTVHRLSFGTFFVNETAVYSHDREQPRSQPKTKRVRLTRAIHLSPLPSASISQEEEMKGNTRARPYLLGLIYERRREKIVSAPKVLGVNHSARFRKK